MSELGVLIAPSGALENRIRLRWAGAVLAAITLLLFLESGHRASVRCHQECYGAPPLDRYGSLTYEPGHAWTRYADSWQWSTQHGLTQFALVAVLVGLALAFFSERTPVRMYLMAIVALAGWVTWVSLSPSASS